MLSVAARFRAPLALAVILGATAAIYARSLDAEFQFDDRITIERNPEIKDLGAFVRGRTIAGYLAGDRSVTNLTFALDRAMAGGLKPRTFHATSLAVHLLATLLAFLVARAIARRAGVEEADWLALAATALFALHPLQAEAVCYASQRSEALASAFYLAAILLLLAADRGSGARASIAWAGAFAAFLLGMGAKATVVTLPAAWLWLTLVLPGGTNDPRPPWRRRLALIVPVAVAAALFAWRTVGGIVAANAPDAGFAVPGITSVVYLATQARVLLVYLRLLAWPSGQTIAWDFPPSSGLLDPRTIAAGAVIALAAAVMALLWLRARRMAAHDAAAVRVAVFGLGWFLLLLAPTSSVIPLADVLVEHRLYLAGLGVFLAVGAGAERLLSRVTVRARGAVAAVLLLAVATASAGALAARVQVWRTRVAIWEEAVTRSPGLYRSHENLGSALQARGDVDRAMAEYRRALDLHPPPEDERSIAINASMALVGAGRVGEGISLLSEALARSPFSAELATNMAVALIYAGRLSEAEEWATRATSLAPALGEARSALGSVRLRRGDPRGAVEAFEAAARLNPDLGGVYYNLGIARYRLGETGAACAAWRRAAAAAADGAARAEATGAMAQVCAGRAVEPR